MNKKQLFGLPSLGRMCMAVAVALTMGACFTSCSDDDDDDKDSAKNNDAIMLAIDNKAFNYDDSGYSYSGEYSYRHYYTFTKTSENGGTVGYRCEWRDTEWYGEANRGVNIDYGTFSISNGKIYVTMENNYPNIAYFGVMNNSIVDNEGNIYKHYGKASDVLTHKRAPEDWQSSYNGLIADIYGLFMEYDCAKEVGDIKKANEKATEIKNLQSAAKSTREDAAKDHVYIEQDPLETKPVYRL